jgi:hypothetical protein
MISSCTWTKHGLTKITADYMWLPNDGSDASKIPSGKDKRLLFCMQVRDARVWSTAAIKCFWPNQRMATITRRWIVLKIRCAQILVWKKAVLQNYLTQHNIPFSATDTKKVLYGIIKPKKDSSSYKTDKIANLHGHEVIRTPVRHWT